MESGAGRSREIFNSQSRGDCDTGDLPGKVPDTQRATPNTGTTKHSTSTSNVIKFVVNMVAPTPNPEAYPVSEMAVEALSLIHI